ncbi:hypothetical protein POVWA1_047330 [Plasmodium ovale wallikeri]|uniref:Uncharacterized protein n=1 Tax=Plasmodium ovale wallikeri TaxID=864142 RepID=A0A1A8ZGZ1_PLAOA|nr:hypothetical protein POVWA1_047330 [Plasmodium ovale wallikeri]
MHSGVHMRASRYEGKKLLLSSTDTWTEWKRLDLFCFAEGVIYTHVQFFFFFTYFPLSLFPFRYYIYINTTFRANPPNYWYYPSMKNCLKNLSTFVSIDQIASKIFRNDRQREFLLIYESSCLLITTGEHYTNTGFTFLRKKHSSLFLCEENTQNGKKRVKTYPGEALQTCHTQCIFPDTEPLRAFKKNGKTVNSFCLLNEISFANKTKGEGAKWMKVMGKNRMSILPRCHQPGQPAQPAQPWHPQQRLAILLKRIKLIWDF